MPKIIFTILPIFLFLTINPIARSDSSAQQLEERVIKLEKEIVDPKRFVEIQKKENDKIVELVMDLKKVIFAQEKEKAK